MRIKGAIILIITIMMLAWVSWAASAERAYLFRYSFTVKDIPINAKEIKIWVPYPTESPYQHVEELAAENPVYKTTLDKAYGNKILNYVIKHPGVSSLTIRRAYKIRRGEFENRPIAGGKNDTQADRVPASEIKRYTAQDGFVTISDDVRRLAAQATVGKQDDVEKARAIYDFVFKRMSYDKTVPGWGKGDIERVCLLWSGNCTDFHSLFIALCRASGIPAKFVMGVPLPQEKKGEHSSYHCWAEFYAPGYGWVPVDISEAWKNKPKQEYFFGAVDENRIELSHGRGIELEPTQKRGPLNYFIFPYVEVDGKIFENVETVFSYEDIVEKGKGERKDEPKKI